MRHSFNTKAFYDSEAKQYEEKYRRPVQDYTHELEKEQLQALVKSDDKILDLGCGIGRLTAFLASLTSQRVCGLDLSVEMINTAQRVNSGPNISYFIEDAANIRSEELLSVHFDKVIAITSLNNIPDIDAAFISVKRLLNPDGMFIAEIINSHEAARPWRWIYLFPYFLAKLLGLWPHKWHERFYSLKEIEAVAARNGFRIDQRRGLRFLPDWLPMVPFNTWRPLRRPVTALFNALKPFDLWLSRHEPFSRWSRFHWIVFKKT